MSKHSNQIKRNPNALAKIREEVRMLEIVDDHKNIVNFVEYFETKKSGKMYIVTQF